MTPRITTEDQLRDFYPHPPGLIDRKVLDGLDVHCLRFIARSPLVFVATSGADGTCDVSPRGDQPGFVRTLSPNRIALPDRKGNNRLDGLRNVLTNPHAGLVFVIPGIDDTLRVNGRASVVVDDVLLETLAVAGRPPTSALVIDVEEAFLHCGRAFKRGQVWDPDSFAARDEVPRLADMLSDQTSPNAEERELLAHSEEEPLW